MEVSRRKLGVGLELRREVIVGFGCFQCTTESNIMGPDKVSQGYIIDREEQIKGSRDPREGVMHRDTSHLQLFLVLLRSHWGATIGNNG